MFFRIHVFRVQVFQSPCFSGSTFFRDQVFQGPGFSESKFFRVQVFQGPGYSGSRFFRVQVFQGPSFSGSRFFMVQVIQGPGFSGSESRVRVQVLEVVSANISLFVVSRSSFCCFLFKKYITQFCSYLHCFAKLFIYEFRVISTKIFFLNCLKHLKMAF